MESRTTPPIVSRLQIILISLMCIFLPLVLLPNSTDPFSLAKGALLIIGTTLTMMLWVISSLYKKAFIYKSSPFNLPVALFAGIILLSSLLSRNIYDSLMTAAPVLAASILYFAVSFTVSNRKSLVIIVLSLLGGGVLSAIISICYYFKVYFLPMPGIDNRYFSPFGSSIQEIIYLIAIFMFPLFSLLRNFKLRKLRVTQDMILEAVIGLILIAGIAVLVLSIITAPQKPIMLPYTYGLQIAAVTISQDVSRLLISFPFGSGYGTFINDFARFRLQELNTNIALATAYPTYSSSFALELMTTTGILGLLSFLFLVYKTLRTRLKDVNPSYFALLILFIVSFFLPFGITSIAVIFILLGIYTASLFLSNDRRVHNVNLSLVALDQGIFSSEELTKSERVKTESLLLPIFFGMIVLLVGGLSSYFTVKLITADLKMVSSVVVPQGRKLTVQQQYDLERSAVGDFPYKSDYHRTFSQLNMNLANSIANNLPKGSSPSAEVRTTINSLIQQSVASARTAADIAPLTSTNWSNLAQVYRSLIGVGQGADQFALSAMNQAVLLDPTNPFLRLDFGGIYFQLRQFDLAQSQFQTAINLKPDFANAYYNLGHVVESKGDLTTALSLYQTTLTLVGGNAVDKKKLEDEINLLKKKIAESNAQGGSNSPVNLSGGTQQQTPIGINAPSAKFPAQKKPVKIAPPPGQTQPTPATSSAQ